MSNAWIAASRKCALAVLASLPLRAGAQSPPPPPPVSLPPQVMAIRRLDGPLGAIRARVRPPIDPSPIGTPRVFTPYDRLQRFILLNVGIAFPPEFLESLELLAERLELVDQDSVISNQAAALEAADQDLLLKVQFLELTSGIGFGNVGVIRVVLSTVRDTAKVMGLSVSSDPFLFADSLNPRFVFNNTTSPTETELPPGAYMLFIKNAEGHIIARRRIDLGANGRLEEEIRIEIPPP